MTAVAVSNQSVSAEFVGATPSNSLAGVGAVSIGFITRDRRHLPTWKEHEDQKPKPVNSVPGEKLGAGNRVDLSQFIDDLIDADFLPTSFAVIARRDGSYRQAFVFVPAPTDGSRRQVIVREDFEYLRKMTDNFYWKCRGFRNPGTNGGNLSYDCDYAVVAEKSSSTADLQVNSNLVEFATGSLPEEKEGE